jgi:hypothetical protein
VTSPVAFIFGFGCCLALVLIAWGVADRAGGPPVDDSAVQEAQEAQRTAEAANRILRDSLALERVRADTVILTARVEVKKQLDRAESVGRDVTSALDSLELSVRPELTGMVQDVRRLVEAEREAMRAVHAAQAVHIQALQTQLSGADRMVDSLRGLRVADARLIEAHADRAEQLEARVRHFERRAAIWERVSKLGGGALVVLVIAASVL